MRKATLHPFLAAAAAAATFAFSAPVLAQSSECESNSDCSDGWICAVVGSWGSCSAPTCPEGESCAAEPVCVEGEIRECVAPPCAGDADCGPGLTCVVPDDGTLAWCEPKACTADADCGDEALKCVEDNWEECTGTGVSEPSCPLGTDCPEPEAVTEECTTHTERLCAPRYVGPCETAADCGAGFDCVPEEDCWCMGSGGATSSEGLPEPSPGMGGADVVGSGTGGAGTGAMPGEEPPTGGTDTGSRDLSTEPECACEPTGTSYCVLQELPCETDAACPEGWSCVSGPTAVVDCEPAGPAAECVQPEPEPSRCEPPVWRGWVTLGGSDESDSDGVGVGSTIAPRPAEDGDATEDLSEVDAGSVADAEEDVGCQVAMGSRAGGSALGLLLGLVGLGALRRRR